MHAIQSSLETLRSHRPDYTPRTGYVWPIIDSSISDEAAKKKSEEEAAQNDILSKPGSKKKQKNNILLMNAMRTTGNHTRSSTTAASLHAALVAESDVPSRPGPIDVAIGSSTGPSTPATHTQPKTPAADAGLQESNIKGPPGGGKKKRKR